jgi:tripartite-type tricarboxylate transporter receptor subunit TctC
MSALAYRLVAAATLVLALSSGAQAQSAPEFYKGRQLTLVVGHEVGNDYDVGARLLAKHLSKQLPGQPAIVVQNMPQAAALAAANFIYVRAARDGMRGATTGSAGHRFPAASAP